MSPSIIPSPVNGSTRTTKPQTNSFDIRKKAILSGLLEAGEQPHGRPDRSLKGTIDQPLIGLIDLINTDLNFVSTSCCSGRFAVYLDSESGRKEEGRLLVVSHDCIQPTTDGVAIGTSLINKIRLQFHTQCLTAYNRWKSTPVLSAAGALSHFHNPLTTDGIVNSNRSTDREHPTASTPQPFHIREAATNQEIQTLHPHPAATTATTANSQRGILWLNLEPFIIHVECRDLDAARQLMEIARRAGLKQTGLMSLKRRVTLAMRGSRKFYVPIGVHEGSDLLFDVSSSYIQRLVTVGNKLLEKNWGQIQRLQTLLQKSFAFRQPVDHTEQLERFQLSPQVFRMIGDGGVGADNPDADDPALPGDALAAYPRRLGSCASSRNCTMGSPWSVGGVDIQLEDSHHVHSENHNNIDKHNEHLRREENPDCVWPGLHRQHLCSSKDTESSMWVGITSFEDIKTIKSVLELNRVFDRRSKILSFGHGCERRQREIPWQASGTPQHPNEAIDSSTVPVAALAPILKPFSPLTLNCRIPIAPTTAFSASQPEDFKVNADDLGRLRVVRTGSSWTNSDTSGGSSVGRSNSEHASCGSDGSIISNVSLRVFHLSPSTVSQLRKVPRPNEQLRHAIRHHIQTHFTSLRACGLSTDLTADGIPIPTRWEVRGNIVLFPKDSFSTLLKLQAPKEFWADIAASMKCSGVGIQGRIKGDLRESQVKLLYTTASFSPIVHHKENGITYVFDITQCMFSRGNYTERSRLPDLIRQTFQSKYPPEVFVDMYCGIGYFSLPVLVKCPETMVSEVWACDWNPNSIQYFLKGLEINSVASDPRLRVLQGDSRKLGLPDGPDLGQLKGRATRLSLGLIPSSSGGWRAAVRLLSVKGAMLHVHQLRYRDRKNRSCYSWSGRESPRDAFLDTIQNTFYTLLKEERDEADWMLKIVHVQTVKSYGPAHDHVVVDLLCRGFVDS